MKTLLVLRHAKSSWKDPGLEDHDRPLNKRGTKTAPRMGKWVKQQGQVPGLILSSTALRAKMTAVAVADKCKYPGDIVYDERLYMAGPNVMVDVLREVDDEVERVMIVGHNPGQEELIRALTGREETLPTGALACIELPISKWQDIEASPSGRLLGIWRPKEVGD